MYILVMPWIGSWICFCFCFFISLFLCFFLQSVLGLWSWSCAQSALRKIIPTTVHSNFYSILFYSLQFYMEPMAHFLVIYSHRPSSIIHRPCIHQTILIQSFHCFCAHIYSLEVFPVYSLRIYPDMFESHG